MFSWSLADEHIAGRGFEGIMGGLYPVAKKEGGGAWVGGSSSGSQFYRGVSWGLQRELGQLLDVSHAGS